MQVVHPYSAVPGIGAVVVARAAAVTASAVQLEDGRQIDYNYLILAPGSSYSSSAIKAFSGSLAERKAAIQAREPLRLTIVHIRRAAVSATGKCGQLLSSGDRLHQRIVYT